jgi:hypothetical protein
MDASAAMSHQGLVTTMIMIAGSSVTTIIISSIITIAQPVIFSAQRIEFRFLFRAEGNRLGINA